MRERKTRNRRVGGRKGRMKKGRRKREGGRRTEGGRGTEGRREGRREKRQLLISSVTGADQLKEREAM